MAADGQERGSAGVDQTPAAMGPRATTLAVSLCNSNRGVLGWHEACGSLGMAYTPHGKPSQRRMPLQFTAWGRDRTKLHSRHPGGLGMAVTQCSPTPETFLLCGSLVRLGRPPPKETSVSTSLLPKAANTNMTLTSRRVFFLLLHQNLHISHFCHPPQSLRNLLATTVDALSPAGQMVVLLSTLQPFLLRICSSLTASFQV